ncbi:MAG TPA: hypothetical protein VMV12_05680 [Candidatus Micrarchaeaceae archaeon]|nr:hypothetical protein [Candidatus Micrarchaeaceae archaeon]
MTSTILDSSWTKFHWAQKHLYAFDRALQRVFHPNPYPISIKTEVNVRGDTAIAFARVAAVPLMSKECSTTLGDTLQNFRAALDHLAWDLVKIGGTPRPKRPDLIYFPLARRFNSWRGSIDTKLPGVANDHRAIIRTYQPYGRKPGQKAVRRLRDLSDGDKHRVLVPIAMNVHPRLIARVETNWVVTRQDYLVVKPTRLKVNTPLLRIHLVRPQGSGGDCEVDVNGEFPVYPALPGGAPVAALGEIRDTVFEILKRFDDIL